MAAIGLRFTDESGTGLFESGEMSQKVMRKEYETKTAQVNYRNTIRYILMKVDGKAFTGLRLGDVNGKLILDLSWREGGEWVGKEVPHGEDVIGLQVNRTGVLESEL